MISVCERWRGLLQSRLLSSLEFARTTASLVGTHTHTHIHTEVLAHTQFVTLSPSRNDSFRMRYLPNDFSSISDGHALTSQTLGHLTSDLDSIWRDDTPYFHSEMKRYIERHNEILRGGSWGFIVYYPVHTGMGNRIEGMISTFLLAYLTDRCVCVCAIMCMCVRLQVCECISCLCSVISILIMCPSLRQ